MDWQVWITDLGSLAVKGEQKLKPGKESEE